MQHCGLCLSICHIWRHLLICSMSVWSEKAPWACQSWQIWRSTRTYVYFNLPLSSHTFGIIINIIDDYGIYHGMWKPSRSSQVGTIEKFINQYLNMFPNLLTSLSAFFTPLEKEWPKWQKSFCKKLSRYKCVCAANRPKSEKKSLQLVKGSFVPK